MKYVVALIVGGLIMLAYGCARADWQVHEWDGKEWKPAVTPKGYRARVVPSSMDCLFDLADIGNAKPSGTRLQCREVQSKLK